MMLVAGGAAAAALFVLARRWERDGNPERFVGLVVAVLLVECLVYPAQANVPVGPFRVPFLGGGLRTHDALVVVGVVARLTVRPLPSRVSITGVLWSIAFVWLGAAAARGLLAGHSTNVVMFSAMSLFGLFGGRLLVAGCDPSRLVTLLRGRWVIALAAVVLVLIPFNAGGDGLHLLSTGLGGIHVDTASVFAALGTFVLLVEWSSSDRSRLATWAAVPLLMSPFASEQRATLLQLAATVLVITWAMTRPEWRSKIRVPKVQLLWGLLVVVAAFMVVLIVRLSSDDGSVPFAGYYHETFTSPGQQLSAQARAEALEVGLDEWASAPVYGHGLGHTYEILRPGRTDVSSHGTFDNVPLDLLVRSGVVGLVLAALAYLASLRDGFAVWRRDRRPTISALALAAAAVLVGLGTKSVFESILEKGKLALLMGLCAGVIAATRRSAPEPVEQGRPVASPHRVTSVPRI